MQDSMNHNPDGRWEFDKAVTDCFEDMLERSIPQYEIMRATVASVAAKYVTPGSTVLDLGCSKGQMLEMVMNLSPNNCNFIGVDISPPMIEAATARFRSMGNVKIESVDLRANHPKTDQTSVAISCLTLQFIPIEYRQTILKRIYDDLQIDGAFILVEKILGSTAEIDGLMVDLYLRQKAANGYSQENIDRKRLSLEGVLVPVTARWNEDLLAAAGFKQIDCLWRWMNFAAWVAIK